MKFQISKEERELFAQCLGSKRLAQKQLYDKYKDAMYTLAFRMLREK